MYQKILSFGLAAALLFWVSAAPAYSVEAAAKGAVLIEAQSGRVLFAKNEQKGLPMASTTKIMTAMITLEQENLDEPFTVDSAAIQVEGSSMGLCEGDTVTLRALAVGMLLPSGNDAANAAAVRIAGDIPRFIQLMNERAAQLGMKNTAFETPSGLDAKNHYASALDMAKLAQAALRNPDFAEICAQSHKTLEYGNPPYKRWLKNHNRLLEEYTGAIGVKTGFTGDAGRCLVSAARRDGVTLICVTLACPDDWRTHTQLLDYGFEQLRCAELGALLPPLTLPVGGGTQASVAAVPARPLAAALAQGEQERVCAQVLLQDFVLAPLAAGAYVGEVHLMLDGTRLDSVPLYAAESVAARPLPEKKGLLLWLKGLFF